MMLRFNGRHTGDIDITLPNDLNVLEQFKNVLRKESPELVDYVLFINLLMTKACY